MDIFIEFGLLNVCRQPVLISMSKVQDPLQETFEV